MNNNTFNVLHINTNVAYIIQNDTTKIIFMTEYARKIEITVSTTNDSKEITEDNNTQIYRTYDNKHIVDINNYPITLNNVTASLCNEYINSFYKMSALTNNISTTCLDLTQQKSIHYLLNSTYYLDIDYEGGQNAIGNIIKHKTKCLRRYLTK